MHSNANTQYEIEYCRGAELMRQVKKAQHPNEKETAQRRYKEIWRVALYFCRAV